MRKIIFVSALSIFFSSFLLAQCEQWTGSPNEDALTDAHSVYRGLVKAKDYEAALPHWEKVYTAAPAADGKRSSHYIDGIEIHMDMFGKATDKAAKQAASDKVMELYDGWAECYPKEAAAMRGDQVYKMFYTLQRPYAETVKTIQQAMELGGDNTSYSVIDPYSRITVHQFKEKQIDAAEARDRNEKLMALAEAGIKNSKDYSQYYQQSKDAVISLFSEIEREIFDCEYFKSKYIAQYKADPDNKEVYKEVYKQLKRGGCDNSDPIVYEIFKKDSIATMRTFNANNPAFLANKMYKAGDFNGAMAKYQEAISSEADPEKKGSYLFSVASIQFRKLKKYSDARRSALQAAELRPNWGKPYMLIGDMYASSSGTCGTKAFGKGLAAIAAIDKYRKAKSVDPSFADEASKKIGKYMAYRPDEEEAFMMGVKAGQSKKVPCWIGETVSVSFK